MESIASLCRKTQAASFTTAVLSTAKKNQLLLNLAAKLEEHEAKIMAANQRDVSAAQAKGLAPALVDRLTLTKARFNEMVNGVRQVASLTDPIGQTFDGRVTPTGLTIVKRRVPLGVVGVIYESRPNVTADIAALCLKSGNACVLRGGSEAINSNLAIYAAIEESLEHAGVDPYAVSLIKSTAREDVQEMLAQDAYIDVIVPRGGEALHRFCQHNSAIPVIVGGFGISHIYVAKSASLNKAVPLIINAKVQKPSACNALDTLLIEASRVEEMCALLIEPLKEHQVTVHAHGACLPVFEQLKYPYLQAGVAEDFDKEWLSLTLNIAPVENVQAAIEHLRAHHAMHSDSILSNDLAEVDFFVRRAGSACVYVNASTRFTDGGQFGLGAEVAISTQKLHARGPMALTELTTYQYVCSGDYLCRG